MISMLGPAIINAAGDSLDKKLTENEVIFR